MLCFALIWIVRWHFLLPWNSHWLHLNLIPSWTTSLWYLKHFLNLTPKIWSYLFYHNSCRVCTIYQPYSGVISASTLCKLDQGPTVDMETSRLWNHRVPKLIREQNHKILSPPIDPVSCAAAATQFVLLAAASTARDVSLKTNNTGARLAW